MEEAAEAKMALGQGGDPTESTLADDGQTQESPEQDTSHVSDRGASTDGALESTDAVELALKLPLDKTDRDFAQGRLAQAEAMEKYGLVDQALAQCAEITHRFSGHTEAWERTTRLLLLKGAIGPLRDALVALALAKFAAGDRIAAAETVKRARSKAPLDLGVRARLQALGLLEKQPQGSASSVILDAPVPRTVVESVAEEDVLIDFEFEAEAEIEVEAEVEDEPVEEPEPVHVQPPEPSPVPLSVDPDTTESDEDDLSAIAAALESTFVDEDLDSSLTPESESEESIDEVFAAFKEQVAKEVEEDDHRTHYDLGIAYKEMGLLEEAVGEFEKALAEPSLCCEACTMIAILYRELEDSIQAVAWYRKALESTADGEAVSADLRYDMAGLLVEVGETEQAIEIYRDLETGQPGFRDARVRIDELEARS
jgi:tetratricopeptide (TPR) repeat protein